MMSTTDYKFELIPAPKYYKTYRTWGDNYIRNTKTGANVGQTLRLRVWFEDESGRPLPQPIYEEDCYEYVYSNKYKIC